MATEPTIPGNDFTSGVAYVFELSYCRPYRNQHGLTAQDHDWTEHLGLAATFTVGDRFVDDFNWDVMKREAGLK